MIKLLKIVVLSVSLILTACSSDVTTSSQQAQMIDYFADNAFGNALAVVQHPAGVHVNGVTYVSYQGPKEDPYVAAFDHNNNTWLGPIKAGVSDLGKKTTKKFKIDNHGKPTMLIDDLGYIHIFYGGHGAGKKYGKNPYGGGGLGRNKHAVSRRPYDISEWQDLDNISIFGTYNQAIKMDNGDIYLIYRHGAHRSDWVYQKSTDHGRTFEPAVPILKHKHRTDMPSTDSWYVWASKGQRDDIILSYDYHVCWLRGKGPRGLGHVTQRHDLYYMVLDTKTETLRDIQNNPLPIPVNKEIADKHTLVAKTGDDWGFNGSAHTDNRGYPHIAINIGKNLGTNTGGPKQTHYYKWDGKKWIGGNPVNIKAKQHNTSTRGDFVIDDKTQQATFFLGYKDGTAGVIAKFTSNDNGLTFSKTKELLRKPNASWALTAIIENAHPNAQLIVAEKNPGSLWHKIYLVGEEGSVLRSFNETQLLTREDRDYINEHKKY